MEPGYLNPYVVRTGRDRVDHMPDPQHPVLTRRLRRKISLEILGKLERAKREHVQSKTITFVNINNKINHGHDKVV